MIPYMVGKLAPNSSHLTRGLVKYVPDRSYFRAVSSQNGVKFVITPPLPPVVERVSTPHLAQRRDGALSLTTGCSTRHWLDPFARVKSSML